MRFLIWMQRWRVNDNLPGTRHFCPMVVKTEAVTRACGLDVQGLFGALKAEFGDDLLMRSAVWMTLRESKASFAIEGEADRVGRVHRFLVNDILRRDGVIPDPVILPISAVITDDAAERRGYDQVLEQVSRPLMEAVRDQVVFEPLQTSYPDGAVSNLAFHGVDQARPLWRYPDLGPHVAFLSNIIGRTLTEQMPEESRYLRRHARARAALKEVVEMPDPQADRVLRSLEQNRGDRALSMPRAGR